eukprot:10912315-Prorocentrum_lima.AAC.1
MTSSLVGLGDVYKRQVNEQMLQGTFGTADPVAVGSQHIVYLPKIWEGGSVSYTHLTLPTICSV